MNKETLQNKMLGCLYGQAIGDALGLGTELIPHSEIFFSQNVAAFFKKTTKFATINHTLAITLNKTLITR